MAALCEKVWVEKDLLHASGIMTTLNAALKEQFPNLRAKVIADFTLPWIQSKCDEINNGMQKKKLEGSHGQVWPLAKIFKLFLPSAGRPGSGQSSCVLAVLVVVGIISFFFH